MKKNREYSSEKTGDKPTNKKLGPPKKKKLKPYKKPRKNFKYLLEEEE